MLNLNPYDDECRKVDKIFKAMYEAFSNEIKDSKINVREIFLLRTYLNKMLDLQLLENFRHYFDAEEYKDEM